MIPHHHTVSIEKKDVPEKFFNKSEYKKMDMTTYIDLRPNMQDFEKDNMMISIYKGYALINKNYRLIDYAQLIFEKIIGIDSADLIGWLNRKPTYDILKYASIPLKEFDKTYKSFIDLIPRMKRTKNLYIVVNIRYKQSNQLFDDLYHMIKKNRINGVIRIKKPMIVEKSLSYSVFADTCDFLTKGTDKNILATNRIDTDYPMMILIRYNKLARYLPLHSDYGMVFEIKRLKITKIEKKQITDSVSYYLVDAS